MPNDATERRRTRRADRAPIGSDVVGASRSKTVRVDRGGRRELINGASSTDEGVMAWLAPVSQDRWREFFGLDLEGDAVSPVTIARLIDLAYSLSLVVPFDWTAWWRNYNDHAAARSEPSSAATQCSF